MRCCTRHTDTEDADEWRRRYSLNGGDDPPEKDGG
jgi:hypothetical protein